MTKDVNKVILLGRLGADPVQRQTKTGMNVAHFPVATSRRFLKEGAADPAAESSATANWTEETQWHQVVSWGRQAEKCSLYLKKGNPVYIEGSIRSHQYEDKAGISRTSFEIHVETISFLGGSSRPKPQEVISELTENAVPA